MCVGILLKFVFKGSLMTEKQYKIASVLFLVVLLVDKFFSWFYLVV